MKKWILGLLALSTVALGAARNIPVDTLQPSLQGSAPGSPTAATRYLYALNADGKLYMKDSAGNVYNFPSPISVGTSGQALISGGAGHSTWFAPTAGSVLFAGASGILAQDNASLFFNDSTNRVGIGTTAPTSPLTLVSTNTSASSGGQFGSENTLTVSPASNQTVGSGTWRSATRSTALVPSSAAFNVSSIYGFEMNSQNDAAGISIGNVVGAYGQAYNTANSTVTSVGAFEGYGISEAGTVTDLYGGTFVGYATGGTITRQTGVYTSNNSDGATVTDRYGLWIDTPAGTATNDYAIYSTGTQKSHLNGNVGIATTAPSEKLHVVGNSLTTSTAKIGVAGSSKGSITLSGNTSGTVTISPKAAAGSYTLTLPDTDGDVDEVLTTDGSGNLSWSTGGSGSGTAITTEYAIATHGFAVGDVVYCTATTTCAKAKADAESTAEVLGIVTLVTDVNNFSLTMIGYATGLSGLTANTTYYLSGATAGALTSTEPTTVGHISKPVFFADSTTSGYVLSMRGQVVTAAAPLGPVSSNHVGERIERAELNCDAASSITSQSGSWLSAIGNRSTAACSITIASGIFSATPSCVFTVKAATVQATAVNMTSSTAGTVYGASADYDGYLICMGAQ